MTSTFKLNWTIAWCSQRQLARFQPATEFGPWSPRYSHKANKRRSSIGLVHALSNLIYCSKWVYTKTIMFKEWHHEAKTSLAEAARLGAKHLAWRCHHNVQNNRVQFETAYLCVVRKMSEDRKWKELTQIDACIQTRCAQAPRWPGKDDDNRWIHRLQGN